MALSGKKLERTAKFTRYFISIILCIFLILLSDKIVGDLDGAATLPMPENFENKSVLSTSDKQLKNENLALDNLNLKIATTEKTMATAKDNYINEKQSFDNWVQTRKTLGSPENDQEVISRAKKIDEYYKIEQDWRTRLNSLQEQIKQVEKRKQIIQNKIDKEKEIAYKQYDEAIKWYELNVFLIRLVFVVPLLALGIFFFVRRRQNKFWALYFGFTLFSLYAFFFGLVPYLPSYGGYVRYSVGVILSAISGYYTIKYIGKFIERKQAELKISTQERAKNVQTAMAEKALENHICPSCGKDFIPKKWELTTKETGTEQTKNTVSFYAESFCRYCGLELFKNCENCGKRVFAHIPFCSSCGCKTTKNN
ncbi:hypothetical protein MASR2M18_08080 [Ignavibacteria bacterium]|jgi:ribosomal protein L32|nr:hypothetical protein [Bacteroidota bacterium]MCZ2132939.1 hypothetical protein [Bacteroidota bacterium]